MTWRIIEDDCIAAMQAMPEASIDACVCDPPYGLSREPDIAEVLTHWLAGDDYTHRSRGFMGSSWDSFVPGPAYWREVYRVLKPGAFLLAFSSTRTADLLGIAIRLAGFERRDQILSLSAGSEVNGGSLGPELAWIFGSGFPKSLDVSKALDKAAGAVRTVATGVKPGHEDFVDRTDAHSAGGRSEGWDRAWRTDPEAVRNSHMTFAPVTSEAVRWQGFGSALKPGHEPIIVARKPLSGTIVQNVLAHGTGAMNIDGCRVDANGESWDGNEAGAHENYSAAVFGTFGKQYAKPSDPAGRWPANVVLQHSSGCREVGTGKVRGDNRRVTGKGVRPAGFSDVGAPAGDGVPNAAVYGDTEEPAWECVKGCPVRGLNAQAGPLSSGSDNFIRESSADRSGNRSAAFGAERRREGTEMTSYGDSGGASRFFYCSKASSAERNAGLAGFEDQTQPVGMHTIRSRECNICGTRTKTPDMPWPTCGHEDWRWVEVQADLYHGQMRNPHSTVKPLNLMRWLVRLVGGQPGSTILDCFAGSGSTGCAAVLEGFDFVGIERQGPAWVREHPGDDDYVAIARARIEFWAGFPVGTSVERVLALENARRLNVEDMKERRRVARDAGQLDLLAGMEEPSNG